MYKEIKMTKKEIKPINSDVETILHDLVTLTDAAHATTNETTKQLLNNEIVETLSDTDAADVALMRDHMESIRGAIDSGNLKRKAAIVETNFNLTLMLTIDDMEE